MTFKSGDWVICIDIDHATGYLTTGAKYRVISSSPLGSFCRIRNDFGVIGTFATSRFALAEQSEPVSDAFAKEYEEIMAAQDIMKDA